VLKLWRHGRDGEERVEVMALYEYRCEMCQKAETVERAMTDQLPRDPYCPNCTIPMKRVYTAAPIHFKGQGWGHQ
jgi:putative FmdB family regulatory protein